MLHNIEKKTKIIATIGPATDNPKSILELYKAGMNVMRINFSHGDYAEQLNKIVIARDYEKQGIYIPVALDTKGPEIRTGLMKDGKVPVHEGQIMRISMKNRLGDADGFSVTHENLINDVTVGSHILIDDGNLDLLVKELDHGKNEIVVEAQNTHVLKDQKGVNCPFSRLSMPYISPKDEADLKFGCEHHVDAIFASFVRRPEDIADLKAILKKYGDPNIPVFAKIENPEGLEKVDQIIEAADGIMVARGDLGVEIPPEDVPVAQRHIIAQCRKRGKPVITATQMLDSMIRNSIPTRAEASDICNAIFDGTDAIMLSGESASGLYPLEAARTMSTIAQEAEANIDYMYLNQQLKEPAMNDFAEAISYSACRTSNVLNANAIVAATTTGATAKLISKYKPKCPIIAITPFDYVQRRLSLNSGVIPLLCREFSTTDEIIKEAIKVAKKYSCAKEGDNIIVAAGLPTSITGGTNMMKIEKI